MFDELGLSEPSLPVIRDAITRSVQKRPELLFALGQDSLAHRAIQAALERTRGAALALDATEAVALDVYVEELDQALEGSSPLSGAARAGAVRIARPADLAGLELDAVVLCRASDVALDRNPAPNAVLGDRFGALLPKDERPPNVFSEHRFELVAVASVLSGARQLSVSYATHEGASSLGPSRLAMWLESRGATLRREPASLLARGAGRTLPEPVPTPSALRRAEIEGERQRYFFAADPESLAGPYTGRTPGLTAYLGGDSERPIAVTALERALRCRFLGFMGSVLRANRDDPVGDAISARERGSLLHAALASALDATRSRLGVDTPAELLATGMEAARVTLETKGRGALRRAGLAATLLDVRAILSVSFAADDGVAFTEAELGFGRGSPWQPLELESLHVSGRIDRIDASTDRRRVRVIDYKTRLGSKGDDSTELQPWLYAEKVAREWGAEHTSFAYFGLNQRTPALRVVYEGPPNGAEIQSAFERAEAIARELGVRLASTRSPNRRASARAASPVTPAGGRCPLPTPAPSGAETVSQAPDPTALALEQNAVIAASAGTGKTHLLTNLYLALVLGLGPDAKPVAAERIAATTFSRAAAREIRERLEQRLAVLAGEARVEGVIGKDAALARLAETRGLSDRELSGRAARALEDLPRAFIDTLHGLATRLVRTHALELELSPGFTILDESAAFEDAETSLDEVLSQALDEGGDSARAALALIDSCHGLEGTRSALLGLFGLLDEEGLGSGELAPPSHLAEGAELAAAMRDAARAVLGHGRSHPLAAAADEVLAALTEPIDAPRLERGLVLLLGERRPKLEKYPAGPELLSLLDAMPAAATSRNRGDQLALAARFVARAPRARGRESRHRRARRPDPAEPPQAPRREEPARLRRRAVAGARSAAHAPRSAGRSRGEPGRALGRRVSRTRAACSAISCCCSGSPRRPRGAHPGRAARSQLAPAARTRRGRRSQTVDLRVPRRRRLGLRTARRRARRRARGACPRSARRARLGEPGGALLDAVRKLPLGAGHLELRERGRAPRLHGSAPPRVRDPLHGSGSAAPGRRDAAPGRVTLIDAEPVPRAEDALLSRAEGPLLAAFTIAGFCARSHAEGTPLANIAVLSRRRAMLPLLEVALDRFQIPFVVAGRALYATPEVRDLAALLRVALDPHDRHALVVVARSPLGGISDPGLVELSEPGRGLLPARRWDPDSVSDARDRALVVELKQRLVELADVGPRLSPRDALSFAVERFELQSVLGAQPRGPGRFGNVGRLLEIAARHGGNLPRFSRWLERQISLEVDESEAAVFSEGDDAVRLLTVHGSKGLAFEVTVLADADAHEVPHSAPLSLLRNDDGSIEARGAPPRPRRRRIHATHGPRGGRCPRPRARRTPASVVRRADARAARARDRPAAEAATEHARPQHPGRARERRTRRRGSARPRSRRRAARGAAAT